MQSFIRKPGRTRGWACLVGFSLAVGIGGAPALADESVNTGYFGGVAIMGYDTVAYFTQGRPVKGSEAFSYEWLGTPWFFANEEHRQMFIGDPVKFAPQYGGYCAGEVAMEGSSSNIDPEAWRIIDGKLYLSYNQGFAAALDSHPDELLAKADSKWPALHDKLEQSNFH
jgi:YHS domain-containing protein